MAINEKSNIRRKHEMEKTVDTVTSKINNNLDSQRYIKLLNSTKCGIQEVDLDGRIIFANKSIHNLYGHKNSELLGKNICDFLATQDDCNELQEYLRLLVNNDNLTTLTYIGQGRTKDGRIIDIEMDLTRTFNHSGRHEGFSATTTDITGRQRNRHDHKAQIDELERKNAELLNFSHTISHGLRSPLISVNGFLRVLKDDISNNDTEQISKDISVIHQATKRMELLVNNLTEISNIDRTPNPHEKVSLNELAQDAIVLAELKLARKKIKTEILGNLPVLNGNRPRLIMVLKNLIDNAIEFMPDKPDSLIQIGAKSENGQTVCFVRDNGLGIPPEHQDRIFGFFNKLDPKSKGIGAGLAIAKRIIEKHNGRIWAESQGQGYGSTIFFTVSPQSKGNFSCLNFNFKTRKTDIIDSHSAKNAIISPDEK